MIFWATTLRFTYTWRTWRAQNSGKHRTEEGTLKRRAQDMESTGHSRAQNSGKHKTEEGTGHSRAQNSGKYRTEESTLKSE